LCFFDESFAAQCAGKQNYLSSLTGCGISRVIGLQMRSGSSVSGIRLYCGGTGIGLPRQTANSSITKHANQSLKDASLLREKSDDINLDGELKQQPGDQWTNWQGGQGGCQGLPKVCPPATFLRGLQVYAGAVLVDSILNAKCSDGSLLTDGDGETTNEEITQEGLQLYQLNCPTVCSTYTLSGTQFAQGLCLNSCAGQSGGATFQCPQGTAIAGFQTRYSDMVIGIRFVCRRMAR
jgi:hypothetical protein